MFSCCMLAFDPFYIAIKPWKLSLQLGYRPVVIPLSSLVSKGTDFTLCQLINGLLFRQLNLCWPTDIKSLNCIHRWVFTPSLGLGCGLSLNIEFLPYPWVSPRCCWAGFSTPERYRWFSRSFPQFDGVACLLSNSQTDTQTCSKFSWNTWWHSIALTILTQVLIRHWSTSKNLPPIPDMMRSTL